MSLSRSRSIFVLLGTLLFLAPLFRSGKVPFAMLLLELLSLGILLSLWWGLFDNNPAIDGKSAPRRLPKIQVAALSGLLLLPLLYLFPFPAGLLESLPGRASYTAAQVFASRADEPFFATLSLYPRETLSGWLLLLLPLATYLAARSLNTKQLRTLVTLLFVIATFQAILGLVQFGTGPDSPFYMGMTRTHFGSAVGTYTSRNNFVGLLYMVLMLSLALFMATLGQHRRKVGQQTLRQRLVYLSSMQGHRAFLFAAFSLLVLLAIVFSRSRAGIGLTMLGVVLASLLFARRIGGGNVYGLTGTIVSVVMGVSISIGLAPVLDRFSASDPLTDARWTIFEGTFQGIAQFFPLGSGPASFRETFQPFQDLGLAGHIINRAHNDYLEWLYTGGLLAGALILLFLSIYVLRWAKVWKTGLWGEFRYIQVGAGIGMALMLLHELVDYNLFIPANMIFFALFAALFFHDYSEATDPNSGIKQQKKGGANTSPIPATADPRLRSVSQPANGQGVKNPFMD